MKFATSNIFTRSKSVFLQNLITDGNILMCNVIIIDFLTQLSVKIFCQLVLSRSVSRCLCFISHGRQKNWRNVVGWLEWILPALATNEVINDWMLLLVASSCGNFRPVLSGHKSQWCVHALQMIVVANCMVSSGSKRSKLSLVDSMPLAVDHIASSYYNFRYILTHDLRHKLFLPLAFVDARNVYKGKTTYRSKSFIYVAG
jgi:hypothetical protein